MMRKIYFILLILLLPLALADLEIEFTSPDNINFNGYLVNLKFGDAVYKEVMDDNQVVVPTDEMGVFTATLDSSNTQATDYWGTMTINTNKVNFLVYPTGYLKGKVLDINGNLVPYAELLIDCYSTTIYDYNRNADNIGFFTITNVPVGSCSMIASKNGLVGNAEFEVNKGEVVSIEIILGESVAKKSNLAVWIIVILLIVLTILISIRFILQRKPKTEAKTEEKQSKQTLALMKTLSEKERKAVDFLLEKDNKVSQAKIRHATRIPRTSLTRVLQSLEKKKIVEIEKEGKMVSVRLTDFFLDKD